MDWQGLNHSLRVISLHPGVSFEVQECTGFELFCLDDVPTTVSPTTTNRHHSSVRPT